MHYFSSARCAIWALAALLLTPCATAGIVMGGTRVIYQEGKKEAAITVTNQDKETPYLVQSWIENFTPNDKRPVPFVVTPPLYRLDAQKQSVLRINFIGSGLPEDRESVFWLDVKSIAPSSPQSGHELQINIKSKFKLFYRPASLSNQTNEGWKQLAFHRDGNRLVVRNPSPWFVSFFSLAVDGRKIENPEMVGPGEQKSWPIAGGSRVTWVAINDFGGLSEPLSASL